MTTHLFGGKVRLCKELPAPPLFEGKLLAAVAGLDDLQSQLLEKLKGKCRKQPTGSSCLARVRSDSTLERLPKPCTGIQKSETAPETVTRRIAHANAQFPAVDLTTMPRLPREKSSPASLHRAGVHAVSNQDLCTQVKQQRQDVFRPGSGSCSDQHASRDELRASITHSRKCLRTEQKQKTTTSSCSAVPREVSGPSGSCKSAATTDKLSTSCAKRGLETQPKPVAKAPAAGSALPRKLTSSNLHSAMQDFDEYLTGVEVSKVAVIGDCHGGRTMQYLSRKIDSHFYPGTIYNTWVTGNRRPPPLHSLLGKHDIQPGCIIIAVFSYGEIDCRSHSQKFHKDVNSLSVPYVDSVIGYVDGFCSKVKDVGVIPIILAVPPPTNHGHVPEGVSYPGLPLRIAATDLLNKSIESVCRVRGVAFSGTGTFDFAKAENGALRSELSDGHVHVDSDLCGPVLERFHSIIRERVRRHNRQANISSSFLRS